MYKTHYNFEKKPFEPTPDPDFIWLSEAHIKTISRFKLAVQKNEGILVLTGDVGTGKTTFTNYLIKILEDQIFSAIIPYPDLDADSFFNYLSDELGINREFDSKGAFLFYLDQFLREVAARNTGVMIVIDDAQNLSNQLIQEIQLLSSIKTSGKKLIRILFVAQSQNNEDFIEKIKKNFKPAVSFNHHFKALTKSETQQYISNRLKKAGASENLIEPDAMDEIFSYSGGCPRLINIICDNALLAGYSENIYEIKKATVEKCIIDLKQSDLQKWQG